MLYLGNKAIAAMLIVLAVVVTSAFPAQASIDGCTVYLYERTDYSDIPQQYYYDCAYICDHEDDCGYCVEYEQPNCPGCWHKICYHAVQIHHTRHRCRPGRVQITCDPPAVCAVLGYLDCDDTSAVYRDYFSGLCDRVACPCPLLEECANCEAPPEDFLLFLAQQMADFCWGEDIIVDEYAFYCDCESGECTKVRSGAGGVP